MNDSTVSPPICRACFHGYVNDKTCTHCEGNGLCPFLGGRNCNAGCG